MSDASDKGRSLLQLAISLRLAAQRLAESANRMQHAATHQRQYLERLNLLRDRIVELLAMCRRLSNSGGAPSQQAPSPSANRTPRAAAQPTKTRLPASAFVEFSNWQEFEKFRHMPPISDKELASCNIDELIRQLNRVSGSGTGGS
jgi:hypothetical protein